jgi:hypothetical protein
MRRASRTLTIFLIILLAMPRVGAAQQLHVVDQGAIQKALAESTENTVAKRQAIRTALQQPDVVRVANHLGLELARAEAAVATLDGAELNQLAAQAQVVNDELSGGQTVRISAILIIIALLLVLLIIVAVD